MSARRNIWNDKKPIAHKKLDMVLSRVYTKRGEKIKIVHVSFGDFFSVKSVFDKRRTSHASQVDCRQGVHSCRTPRLCLKSGVWIVLIEYVSRSR